MTSTGHRSRRGNKGRHRQTWTSDGIPNVGQSSVPELTVEGLSRTGITAQKKGNNKYGNVGTRKCERCRHLKTTCLYEEETDRCENCRSRGFPCGSKVFASESKSSGKNCRHPPISDQPAALWPQDVSYWITQIAANCGIEPDAVHATLMSHYHHSGKSEILSPVLENNVEGFDEPTETGKEVGSGPDMKMSEEPEMFYESDGGPAPFELMNFDPTYQTSFPFDSPFSEYYNLQLQGYQMPHIGPSAVSQFKDGPNLFERDTQGDIDPFLDHPPTQSSDPAYPAYPHASWPYYS